MKLLLISLVLVFSGCVQKEFYIDRPVEVYIPVKCQVPTPEKPRAGFNDADSLEAIRTYLINMENALKACQ